MDHEMRQWCVRWVCLIVVVVNVAGCGLGPRADLAAAERTLTEARELGASELAPGMLAEAETALDLASGAADQGAAGQGESAAHARELAESTLELTRVARVEAARQAEENLAAAEQAADRAAELLDTLPRGRDTETDRRRMTGDLDALAGKIQAVEAEVERSAPNAPAQAKAVAREAAQVEATFARALAHHHQRDGLFRK
ncbi:MAG: hypothetical protein AAGD38_10860 [Acidobacteriota bacterium]